VVTVTGSLARLIQTDPAPAQAVFVPDEVSLEVADRLARAMAPIHLKRQGQTTDIPNSVTVLDLLGVSRFTDLDVIAQWQRADPARSLAVPIGKRAGGEIQILDLHQRRHGSHGLEAGTVGSGKTAFLSAFMAVAATYYHPHDLAFVAIDYKGGDLIRELKDLPHLVGVITNLEGNLTNRALLALKGELQRRQILFNQVGVGDIYEYHHRRGSSAANLPPLPHLVFISDEFAELAKEQPDFIQQLVWACT
jgi:S-DNA-T family DNA segregation ATPase FtsK/SpoIIIE